MFDKSFPLISAALTVQNYNKAIPDDTKNKVRVFRSSPDRVSLQIRGASRFATASIPFDQIPGVAMALLDAAGLKSVDLWDADPPVHGGEER
jgi:hypothetical protein